jgi:hypothetical protein
MKLMNVDDKPKRQKGLENSKEQKYKILKEEVYNVSSINGLNKKELFITSPQTLGYKCEEIIAKPALTTEFKVYIPHILIQKAWSQLYFEMKKLYKKYYGEDFKEGPELLVRTPLSGTLLHALFTKKEIDALPYNISSRILRKKLRTKIKCFITLRGKEFCISSEFDIGRLCGGRQYKIFIPWEELRLYECLLFKKLRKKLNKIMWEKFSEVYKNAISTRFSNISKKNYNLLQQCLSFPYKEDFFCIPKLNSHFKKPFYFVEVKTERIKSCIPRLTINQRKFIRKFKNEVGILILWIILEQDKIKVRWLVPDTE